MVDTRYREAERAYFAAPETLEVVDAFNRIRQQVGEHPVSFLQLWNDYILSIMHVVGSLPSVSVNISGYGSVTAIRHYGLIKSVAPARFGWTLQDFENYPPQHRNQLRRRTAAWEPSYNQILSVTENYRDLQIRIEYVSAYDLATLQAADAGFNHRVYIDFHISNNGTVYYREYINNTNHDIVSVATGERPIVYGVQNMLLAMVNQLKELLKRYRTITELELSGQNFSERAFLTYLEMMMNLHKPLKPNSLVDQVFDQSWFKDRFSVLQNDYEHSFQITRSDTIPNYYDAFYMHIDKTYREYGLKLVAGYLDEPTDEDDIGDDTQGSMHGLPYENADGLCEALNEVDLLYDRPVTENHQWECDLEVENDLGGMAVKIQATRPLSKKFLHKWLTS